MLQPREQLILLNRMTEIGSTPLHRVIHSMGSLNELWKASAAQISRQTGMHLKTAERLIALRSDESWLSREMALALGHQAAVITLLDAEYPDALRLIPDPPLALYTKGSAAFADPSVAIVGSRQASLYGLSSAEQLAFQLAEHGITVVSGLALGIDAAAHRGALKAQGRTFAVLGSGLAVLYPERNKQLAQKIVETRGSLISEYPMQTQPLPYHFPRRNRIISGLSLGVVIVEARHRSGALITADCALEQGKEVFAVPGPMTAINSQGTHKLLKQGARLVTGVEDIFEELGLELLRSIPGKSPAGFPQTLSEAENGVLAVVGDSDSSIDDISAKSGVSACTVTATLLQLELKGCIKQLPGKRFIRARSSAIGK